MHVITHTAAMQDLAEQMRTGGRRVALVPTMGALHRGHLALVEEAKHHGDTIVVSIFVNPTQFGEGEDLAHYPRRLDLDVQTLQEAGVDVVFAPEVSQMYPKSGPEKGVQTWVEVEGLDAHLCGPHRPGHFRGVTTVVAKLFNVCKPHVALFGLKDAQQFVILERMVRDLLMDVELIGVPTVRESDGLALSSRNEYLLEEERRQARVLSEAVKRAAERVSAGEQRAQGIVESMHDAIADAPLARPQYAEVVDAETLQPIERLVSGRQILAATAVYFGKTRLIDSAFIRVP